MTTEESTERGGADRCYRFEDDGSIPNNPTLPLYIRSGALAPGADDPAAAFERAFAANGWRGLWRDGVFGYHHYHGNAHEALGIARGTARVRFGGESGRTIEVRAGDLVVIPAGIGHRSEGASDDFLVVGAYPAGQHPDLCTGKPGEHRNALEAVRRVPLPRTDPLDGTGGPLLRVWRRGREGAAVPAE